MFRTAQTHDLRRLQDTKAGSHQVLVGPAARLAFFHTAERVADTAGEDESGRPLGGVNFLVNKFPEARLHQVQERQGRQFPPQPPSCTTDRGTLCTFGTPEAAATWMLQLDPIAIVIDITAVPGSDCWSHLIGLQEAATREHVPFVMTTRSKRVLDVQVGTTRVIEVANHDDRETIAACIARMVAPVLRSGSSEK